jgi:hypothetical protein
LWRGLYITKEEGLKTLITLGELHVSYQSHDRSSTIRGEQNEYNHLKDKKSLPYFDQVLFSHIKGELSGEADH